MDRLDFACLLNECPLTDTLQWLQLATLSLARWFGVISLLPFMGQNVLPLRVRVALALSMSGISLPLILVQLPEQPLSLLLTLGLLSKECLLGLMIGYAIAISFWAMLAAGTLIDTQRGASLGGIFDSSVGSEITPLGNFYIQLLIVLFMSTGGWLLMIDLVLQSYVAWPVYAFVPKLSSETVLFALRQVDLVFYNMLFLAGPIVAVMLFSELVLGLLSRSIPMLNVMYLAMPIKSALSLLFLILLVSWVVVWFDGRTATMQGVFGVLDRLLR